MRRHGDWSVGQLSWHLHLRAKMKSGAQLMSSFLFSLGLQIMAQYSLLSGWTHSPQSAQPGNSFSTFGEVCVLGDS